MKHVTIPAQWLQELIALCGPEDHELRERVMKSAAPAPADPLATATGLTAQEVDQSPVAWRYQTSTGWHATTDAAAANRVRAHHTVEPLYAAPQQADARDAVTLALGLSLPAPGAPHFAWTYLLGAIRELVKCEEELTLLKVGEEMSKVAAPAASEQDALIEQIRALPTLKAPELDGEESDGTPKHWRSRPFVSLTKLERILRDHFSSEKKVGAA